MRLLYFRRFSKGNHRRVDKILKEHKTESAVEHKAEICKIYGKGMKVLPLWQGEKETRNLLESFELELFTLNPKFYEIQIHKLFS